MPTHVPVCVLGNYRDMGEHRVVLPDDIRDFIAGLNRLDPFYVFIFVVTFFLFYASHYNAKMNYKW